MIKKTDAEIIFDSIKDRIVEMIDRVEKGNYNDAYYYAWRIGIDADIKEGLKKIKKRKIRTKNSESGK